MNRSAIRAASIFASLSAAAVGAHAQNIVADGSFEQAVAPPPWVQRMPGEVFGGWTVDNVNGGIVHIHTPVVAAADGSQLVELNFYLPGGISQTLTTEPGRTYRLSFQLAGQTDVGPNLKHMRIDWGGSAVATVTWDRAATGGQWVPHSFLVTATGSSTVLHFFGLEEVDGGPYLDAVSVEPACGAADVGAAGGVLGHDGLLDNNDFIAFINLFFDHDPAADLGIAAGLPGHDGAFDNNDFIAFINLFFAGC